MEALFYTLYFFLMVSSSCLMHVYLLSFLWWYCVYIYIFLLFITYFFSPEFLHCFGLCLSVCVFRQCLVISDCPCIFKSDALKSWLWALAVLFHWDMSLERGVSNDLYLWVFPSGLVSFQGEKILSPFWVGGTSLCTHILMAQCREGTACSPPLFRTVRQLSAEPSVPQSQVSLLYPLLHWPLGFFWGEGAVS